MPSFSKEDVLLWKGYKSDIMGLETPSDVILLCRYLNRIAKHPVLRKDDDFREFLENPNEVSQCRLYSTSCSINPLSWQQLPKASDTAALSGAGLMRLVKNVGESFSKIAGKKAETDSVRNA